MNKMFVKSSVPVEIIKLRHGFRICAKFYFFNHFGHEIMAFDENADMVFWIQFHHIGTNYVYVNNAENLLDIVFLTNWDSNVFEIQDFEVVTEAL